MNINGKEQIYKEKQDVIDGLNLPAGQSVVSADTPLSSEDLNNGLTLLDQKKIMTPKETAQYLGKSLSWVYKNVALLGGRKLGGSLFFPAKEDLYEHLFGKGEGVEVRLHSGRDQTHQRMVPTKTRRRQGGNGKKGGAKESGTTARGGGDANRHGLFGSG